MCTGTFHARWRSTPIPQVRERLDRAIVLYHASAEVRRNLEAALARSIHVGARRMIDSEWRLLFERAGFSDLKVRFAPMDLLEPARVVAAKCFLRALAILKNLVLDGEARNRVTTMRRVFRKCGSHLSAISTIGCK